MQARLTTKPQQDVIAAINALDLESVKVRLMDPELGEGWSREYAEGIAAAYKNYLTMLVKYQDDAEDIMLSKDVDEFWHTHILQTMKYADDCQAVFGAFLHHNPHIGERTAEDMAKREAMAAKTRVLYELEFGGEQAAASRWAGVGITENAGAYSAASIRPQGAAYSAASITAATGAYSAASIRARDAAYSAASIQTSNAAYSAASIQASEAAYSAASIRASDAAYSAASITASKGAYSAASIGTRNAAYSAATIRSEGAAYSAASIVAQHAAYSAAALSK